MDKFKIRSAKPKDSASIVHFIKLLADFEKLSDEVSVTPQKIKNTLFGPKRIAECLLGEENGELVAFAIYFHNYSTFLGKPGLYLEDLFVKPECRGKGYGLKMLSAVAAIAEKRNCGRFEWAVLDWNKPSIEFYEKQGAVAMKDWTVFRLAGQELTSLARRFKR